MAHLRCLAFSGMQHKFSIIELLLWELPKGLATMLLVGPALLKAKLLKLKNRTVADTQWIFRI